MTSLNDKVAIITGASSGIGRATALLFASQGASLVLNARGREALDEIVDLIRLKGGKAQAVAGDVALAETHERLVDAALGQFGGLDIAVNNAGAVGPIRPIAEVTLSEWQDTLNANLTSAFLAAHSQIPAMLERGSGALVFVSTFVGTSVGLPGMGAYAASKAGLASLTREMAHEFGRRGVRANAIAPGEIETSILSPGTDELVAQEVPMGRLGEPREVAETIYFLCTDHSSYINGAEIHINGGQHV